MADLSPEAWAILRAGMSAPMSQNATLCSAVLRQAAWSFSLSLSAIEVKDHLMAMADEIDAANGGMPEWSSLAEEALAEIQEMEGAMYSADLGCDFSATRRALEHLQELESNG